MSEAAMLGINLRRLLRRPTAGPPPPPECVHEGEASLAAASSALEAHVARLRAGTARLEDFVERGLPPVAGGATHG